MWPSAALGSNFPIRPGWAEIKGNYSQSRHTGETWQVLLVRNGGFVSGIVVQQLLVRLHYRIPGRAVKSGKQIVCSGALTRHPRHSNQNAIDNSAARHTSPLTPTQKANDL